MLHQKVVLLVFLLGFIGSSWSDEAAAEAATAAAEAATAAAAAEAATPAALAEAATPATPATEAATSIAAPAAEAATTLAAEAAAAAAVTTTEASQAAPVASAQDESPSLPATGVVNVTLPEATVSANPSLQGQTNQTTVPSATSESASPMITSMEAKVQSTTQAASSSNDAAIETIKTICNIAEKNLTEGPCRQHREYDIARSGCEVDLTPGVWLRFTQDALCVSISNVAQGYCYKPGKCKTQFPWYIYNSTLPSAVGENSSVTFCMSDSTLSGRGLCCQEKTTVDVLQCSGFYVYRFSSKMKKSICGSICHDLELSAENGMVDGDFLPDKFHGLNDTERDNVLVVILEITDNNKFKSAGQKVYKQLKEKIIEKLNAAETSGTTGRRRRSLKASEVVILDGFPVVSSTNATLLIIARDEQGNVIPKDRVAAAVDNLENTDPMQPEDSGSKVTKAKRDVDPAKLVDESDQPTKPDAVRLCQGKECGDRLWIAILIIIAVVAIIVLIAFLSVWFYKGYKKGRSGNHDVSGKAILVSNENETYHPSGHVNLAMENEYDANRNGKVNASLDGENSVTPLHENSAM